MSNEPMDSSTRSVAPRTDARYLATRTRLGPQILVKTQRGYDALEPRTDLIQHAPPGLNWGRSGSGQAQLALALLAHASGSDEFALKYHQIFQHEFIARLPNDRWELSGLQILQALRFVCVEARLDPEELEEPDLSENNGRKVATLQALLPDRHQSVWISAHGRGRSMRTAASRALLNLLGNPKLRRQSITGLQLELSVFNAGNTQTETEDGITG